MYNKASHILKSCILATLMFCGIAATGSPQDKLSLQAATDSMIHLMRMAEAEPDFVKKQKLGDRFRTMFEMTLKKPYSFTHPFDSIPYVKILPSPDGMLKLYTWRIPRQDGKSEYHGIVQHRRMNKNNPLSDVFVLRDSKANTNQAEKQIFDYPLWYGCLYYDLVEKHDEGQTTYTLIGFDFNDNISYRKYIDILTFNKQGFPVFGAPMFIVDSKGAKSRIIFEYTSQSVMYVAYRPEIDKIVFNYLHPIVPEKQGDASYYVPDITYDGFEFKFGKWLMVKYVPLVKPDSTVLKIGASLNYKDINKSKTQ